MGGNKSKRPRPSYEDGELRDKTIKGKQDPKYQAGTLMRLIKRASKKTPEGA